MVDETSIGRSENPGRSRRSRAAACSTLSLLLIIVFSIDGLPARAQAQAGPEIGGRWNDGRRDVTFDIRRCDQGWCGRIVQAGACGPVKLRLAAEQPHAKNLIGHLERAEAQTDHPVRAYLIGDKISIEDARPIDRSMMTRRMAPPMYQLARTGPAECAGPTPAS